MFKTFYLVLMCIVLCACSTGNVTTTPQTVVTIATTPALEALVQTWLTDIPSSDIARFDLRTVAPLEVSQGIEDGSAQLAIIGNAPPSETFATPLYEEGIAIIIHEQVGIPSVSLDDLADLFSGRITYWNELDGEDVAVQPVIPFSADEVRIRFEELVLADETAAVKALLAPNPDAMIQLVSENPGAIGYLPFSALTDDILTIQVENRAPTRENVRRGRYPLVMPVIACAAEEPLGALRDWIVAIQSPAATATP